MDLSDLGLQSLLLHQGSLGDPELQGFQQRQLLQLDHLLPCYPDGPLDQVVLYLQVVQLVRFLLVVPLVQGFPVVQCFLWLLCNPLIQVVPFLPLHHPLQGRLVAQERQEGLEFQEDHLYQLGRGSQELLLLPFLRAFHLALAGLVFLLHLGFLLIQAFPATPCLLVDQKGQVVPSLLLGRACQEDQEDHVLQESQEDLRVQVDQVGLVDQEDQVGPPFLLHQVAQTPQEFQAFQEPQVLQEAPALQ